jgi:predicted nucleotidyltransferase
LNPSPFVGMVQASLKERIAQFRAPLWSDLDLAIKAKSALDWKQLAEIKETFQESELPFRVDVLDWNDIAESFRKAIEANGYECLK